MCAKWLLSISKEKIVRHFTASGFELPFSHHHWFLSIRFFISTFFALLFIFNSTHYGQPPVWKGEISFEKVWNKVTDPLRPGMFMAQSPPPWRVWWFGGWNGRLAGDCRWWSIPFVGRNELHKECGLRCGCGSIPTRLTTRQKTIHCNLSTRNKLRYYTFRPTRKVQGKAW